MGNELAAALRCPPLQGQPVIARPDLSTVQAQDIPDAPQDPSAVPD